jgi:hypothetical protein
MAIVEGIRSALVAALILQRLAQYSFGASHKSKIVEGTLNSLPTEHRDLGSGLYYLAGMSFEIPL